MIDYDLELRRHHAAFRRACAIGRKEQVLDVGCGAGETTRDAGRNASEGSVLGIDSSAPMIEQARARTQAEGLRNVSYEHANVEWYSFAAGQFDTAISRFGTMFFADPVSAFSSIRLALAPRGRLVMMVWQRREQNEWAVEIQRAVAGSEVASASPPAFSLGDPETVRRILQTAGFVDVTFDPVHEPVFYGADAERAFAFVSAFSNVQQSLEALQANARELAQDRLRALIAAHLASDGVWFDSRVWIVSARRAS